MEIGDKVKVGYAQDWMGQSTQKRMIIDETISGKYVCEQMPITMTRQDGTKYLASSTTGFILKDKSEFTDIHEEITGDLKGG